MSTTTTITFATANFAALKSFLKSADAYVGVSSAMKFEGWSITDVRAYAERVQAVRAAGFDRALVPNSIQNAELRVAGERAAAEAARVAAEAATAAELMALVEAQVAASASEEGAGRPRWQREPNAGTVAKLQALIEAAGGGDEVVLTAELMAEHNIAATWLSNAAAFTQDGGVRFVAALRCGYTVAEFKRSERITLRRAA